MLVLHSPRALFWILRSRFASHGTGLPTGLQNIPDPPRQRLRAEGCFFQRPREIIRLHRRAERVRQDHAAQDHCGAIVPHIRADRLRRGTRERPDAHGHGVPGAWAVSLDVGAR